MGCWGSRVRVASARLSFMNYYIYILLSLKDGKYYIGSTSNIERRLKFHNTGLQKSTKSRTPFKLIHSESFDSKEEALKRERQIKSYKGGEAFKKLLRGSPRRGGVSPTFKTKPW